MNREGFRKKEDLTLDITSQDLEYIRTMPY